MINIRGLSVMKVNELIEKYDKNGNHRFEFPEVSLSSRYTAINGRVQGVQRASTQSIRGWPMGLLPLGKQDSSESQRKPSGAFIII